MCICRWNDGVNYLIFNMLFGEFSDYKIILEVDIGKAMIVGGGFFIWIYRRGFDVFIFVFNLFLENVYL